MVSTSRAETSVAARAEVDESCRVSSRKSGDMVSFKNLPFVFDGFPAVDLKDVCHSISRLLMLNSSQKAGCMRRSPASHCCQVRQVVCTNSAAAVCDKPDAALVARTSAGVGLRDGEPSRARFGWLLIDFDFFRLDGDAVQLLGFSISQGVKLSLNPVAVEAIAVAASDVIDTTNNGVSIRCADGCAAQLMSNEVGGGGSHVILQPLFPRRGCGVSTLQIIRAMNVMSRGFHE